MFDIIICFSSCFLVTIIAPKKKKKVCKVQSVKNGANYTNFLSVGTHKFLYLVSTLYYDEKCCINGFYNRSLGYKMDFDMHILLMLEHFHYNMI